MKKVLVVMWITIALLVGLTSWLLLNPGAFVRRFQYVPKSELDSVRAEALAKIAQTKAQIQAETARTLAEQDRQIQTVRESANQIARNRMEVEKELEKVQTSSSESRRHLVAVLLEGLSHDEPAVRTWAAQVVGNMGIKEAIPRLTELLQDENERVREAAQKTLTVLASESTGNPRNQ